MRAIRRVPIVEALVAGVFGKAFAPKGVAFTAVLPLAVE